MTITSSKQRLSTMDIPDPIPANLHNLDLSYAIDTFQVGSYKMEDLPPTLPVFNRKTGSIMRNVKGRRVTSMPILSSNSKCLPELPSKTEAELGMELHMKRSVSMFPQNNHLQESLKAQSLESTKVDKDLISATAKSAPITEETDSLFSRTSIMDSTSASSVPSNEYTEISINSRKSIFELNDNFIDDSSSSIYSEVNEIEDDTLEEIYAVEMCLEEPELGSIFDRISLGDSLWDSDKESVKGQPTTGSYASTSILEYYNTPSTEKVGVHTSSKQINLSLIDCKKVLPSLPHSPVDNGLVLPKVRKTRITRPASMFSMTNQSNFSTFTGSKSVHESKRDMKVAINGSIDVCLDSSNDYSYSRYSIGTSKPRATSTSFLSPTLSSVNTYSNVISPRASTQHFNTSKPRALSTNLMNTTQYRGIKTIPQDEESSAESRKPNVGRSVSAFLASTFRAFSSELSTITKK